MSEYPELDRLVVGVRERSETAFADLYRHMSGPLASFAFSMLRDRRSAEDAVQQTFLELVRAAPSIRGDGRSLRAWLFKSIRFTCLDELRRRERRPEYPTDAVPDTPAGPEDPLAVALDPALQRALAQMSERSRSLLVLRHVVGLSGAEVASAMGISRTAAYAATRRAERQLAHLVTSVESEADAASQHLRQVEDTV